MMTRLFDFMRPWGSTASKRTRSAQADTKRTRATQLVLESLEQRALLSATPRPVCNRQPTTHTKQEWAYFSVHRCFPTQTSAPKINCNTEDVRAQSQQTQCQPRCNTTEELRTKVQTLCNPPPCSTIPVRNGDSSQCLPKTRCTDTPSSVPTGSQCTKNTACESVTPKSRTTSECVKQTSNNCQKPVSTCEAKTTDKQSTAKSTDCSEPCPTRPVSTCETKSDRTTKQQSNSCVEQFQRNYCRAVDSCYSDCNWVESVRTRAK